MTNTSYCEYSIKTTDDGQQICSKHIELYIKIKWRNSASCWPLLQEYITMHGHLNVNIYIYIYIYIYTQILTAAEYIQQGAVVKVRLMSFLLLACSNDCIPGEKFSGSFRSALTYLRYCSNYIQACVGHVYRLCESKFYSLEAN